MEDLLFNIKENKICWIEGSLTDVITPITPDQTESDLSKLQVNTSRNLSSLLFRWKIDCSLHVEEASCQTTWSPQT